MLNTSNGASNTGVQYKNTGGTFCLFPLEAQIAVRWKILVLRRGMEGISGVTTSFNRWDWWVGDCVNFHCKYDGRVGRIQGDPEVPALGIAPRGLYSLAGLHRGLSAFIGVSWGLTLLLCFSDVRKVHHVCPTWSSACRSRWSLLPWCKGTCRMTRRS